MNVKILRDYLEKVRLLETDIYTYDKILTELHSQKIPERGKPSLLPEPIKPNEIENLIEPKRPEGPDRHASRKIFKYSLITLFGGVLIETVLPVVLTIPVIYAIAGIAVIGAFYIGLPMGFIKRRKENRTYKDALIKYEDQNRKFLDDTAREKNKMNQYLDNMRLYNQRLSKIKEYEQRLPKEKAFNQAVDEKIRDASAKRAESEAALVQLYEQNIIYRKYRGIVPVTMFCEYMDSGRRTELEGIHGMYDLYETELLGKQIVGELKSINDTLRNISYQIGGIANQLTGIQRNQILLYEEVAKGNSIAVSIGGEIRRQRQSLDALGQSVDIANNNLIQIRESAEMTAFNTEATKNRVAALDELARRTYYEYK